MIVRARTSKAFFFEEKKQETFVGLPRVLLIVVCGGFGGAALGQTSTQTQQTCVDVQVGTAQSYDCLNAKLRQATPHPPPAATPYSATSPGNVTGQFNESATRNRLGSNFGKSVVPERPRT